MPLRVNFGQENENDVSWAQTHIWTGGSLEHKHSMNFFIEYLN